MNALRTLAVATLAAALSISGPMLALADPGPGDETTIASGTVTTATPSATPTVSPTTSLTVGGTTTSATLSSTGTVSVTPTTVTATTSDGSLTTSVTTTTVAAPSATVATTGTVASASVPQTTVTIGAVGGGSPPDLSGISTGSGSVAVGDSAAATGDGLESERTVTTSLTDPNSGATLTARDGEHLDQAASASVAIDEPVTRTTLTGTAGAHALLCLLAKASLAPTRAAFESLCGSEPSTGGASGDVHAANALAGATVDSGAAIRAAVCLLGLVASPLPERIDTTDLAHASLSTLCGGGPSTANGSGDTSVMSERTGTDISAGPVVAAATCLLASGTVGDPTVAQLSSLCASPAGGTSSTGDGTVPIAISDATTGTSADLAPAASAAACILVDALARTPDSNKTVAQIDLSTACGGGTSTTPSTVAGTTPVAVASSGGTELDTAPAVDAAVCILTTAQVGLGGSSLAATDACAGTAAMPPSGAAPPAALSVTSETPPAVLGVSSAPSGPGETPASIGQMPGGGALTSEGGIPVAAGQPAPVSGPGSMAEGEGPAGLAGLPSTSTAVAGMALILAALAAIAPLGRGRRRR